MIGKYQIQLGADQLTSGMASSDYATDGALGISSVHLNPYATRGIIRPTAPLVNNSTNLVGNLIASCEASGISTSYNRLFVDDAANYYSANSASVLTKQVTGTATTHYKFGKTDMVPFAGNIFASLDNDVALWNGGASLTENWGTVTAGITFNSNNLWHPLLVYQGFLWIGDANRMISFDGGSTFSTISLLNSNEFIVATGIDPVTGYMMISFQTQALGNYNDASTPQFFVGLWDGISSKLIRKIPVDEMVTAFINVEGSVYVGAGQTVGVWNGNGVTFLRKLASATFAAANLPYKHHFSKFNNILLVVDGLNILSYGEVVAGGKKAWFPLINNSVNANNIGVVANMGSGIIGIGFATNKFYTVDLTDITTSSQGTLYFNNIYLPRPIFVRRIRYVCLGVVGANASALTTVITDERGNASFASNASRIWNVPAGKTLYVFDVDYGAKLQGLSIAATMNGVNLGIVRVYVYYDVAE